MQRVLSMVPTRYSLRMRLLLSFSMLIMVMLLCALPFFYLFDLFDRPKQEISEALDNYLINYHESIAYQFDNIAAYGIQLNKKLVSEIEKTLEKHNIESFSDVTDNKEIIAELGRKTSELLEISLLISKSSGAFVTFNTTINSNLAKNNKSYSCVYLKISNLDNFNDIDPTIFLLRGMPELADYNEIEFHNMWGMEFSEAETVSVAFERNYDAIPFDKRYSFLEPHYIKNTWERVILMLSPLVGSSGEVYGVCGLEISALLYNLSHRGIQPSIEDISGLIALEKIENGKTQYILDSHFSHGNSFLQADASDKYTFSDEVFYDTFINNGYEFVAKEIAFNPSAIDLQNNDISWHIIAMLPKEIEEVLIKDYYIFIAISFAAFSFIAFIISYFLVYKVSSPVLDTIKNIQEGKETDSNVLDFNDIIEYLKQKENKLKEAQEYRKNHQSLENENDTSVESLQADITAYQVFIERLSTLTKTERKVFELYMQKMTTQEVTEALNVSINTTRTHNRNIYSKLYVSSYKELMVYVQMMVGTEQLEKDN